MKQFSSIQKIDTGILYALELTSSISVLLLAFGLISSMANVLTKGSVLSDSAFLQEVWAWTQCVAIDANVAGSIIRTYTYHQEGDKLKTWLYGLLSVVLLFTACIVSNIEAVKQTLNITLDSAYTHVFVPVELLIWIRSLAIVLIIVSHALRHVQTNKTTGSSQEIIPKPVHQEAEQVVIREVPIEQKALPAPLLQKQKAEENQRKVKSYLMDHPQAKAKELVSALSLSLPTVRKYMKKEVLVSVLEYDDVVLP